MSSPMFELVDRTSLDLASLQIDQTHDTTVGLEDEAGSLRMLITVTGAVSSTDHEISSTKRQEITSSYVCTTVLALQLYL